MNRSTNFNFYLPTNADPMLVSDLTYNFEQIDGNMLSVEQQTLTDAQKAQVRANMDINQLATTTFSAAMANAGDNTFYTFKAEATDTDAPVSGSSWPWAVEQYKFSTNEGLQIARRASEVGEYFRMRHNGSWSAWASSTEIRSVLSITLASGFSATINEVVKTGRVCIVQVNGLTTSTTRSGWYQVGTLPSKATPSGRILGTFVCDNSLSGGKAPVAEVRVNTDGSIEVYSPQSGEKYWGGFTYICNNA